MLIPVAGPSATFLGAPANVLITKAGMACAETTSAKAASRIKRGQSLRMGIGGSLFHPDAFGVKLSSTGVFEWRVSRGGRNRHTWAVSRVLLTPTAATTEKNRSRLLARDPGLGLPLSRAREEHMTPRTKRSRSLTVGA